VAVVVDDGLLVQPFRGHAETGGSKGAETHGGPNDAVPRNAEEERMLFDALDRVVEAMENG
jgi:hypothetical protein